MVVVTVVEVAVVRSIITTAEIEITIIAITVIMIAEETETIEGNGANAPVLPAQVPIRPSSNQTHPLLREHPPPV